MTIRWQYQVVAAPPPGALGAPAETVTLDQWYQPLSAPPRRPVTRIPGWVGYPLSTDPETVTVDKWFYPVATPPPRITPRPPGWMASGYDNAAIAPTLDWLPESQVVRRGRPRPGSDSVYPIQPPAAIEDVTLDKWAGLLSVPVVRKRGREPGGFTPPIEPTLFTTPVIDWLRPTEIPTRPRPRILFRKGFVVRPEEPTVWVEPTTTTTPAPDPVPPWVNPSYPNLKRWYSVDCDVLEGFQTRWFAEGLHTVIPHVYTDDLPANLSLPYAQIQSRMLRQPNYLASIIAPGDDYLDFRQVTISVVGFGKKAVGDLMGTVMGIYSFRLFDVPHSQMRACWLAGEELRADPDTKWGNRVWRGVLEYEVWLVRVLP